MKYLLMYLIMSYICFCADDVTDHGDNHAPLERFGRAALWPLTFTSWFRTGNVRLHRLLNILWALLIMGWFLSLLADRL